MLFYLSFAWRNIWRNKIRSLLFLSTIIIVLSLGILLKSHIIGTEKALIEQACGSFYGHISIHAQNQDFETTGTSFFKSDSQLFNTIQPLSKEVIIAPKIEIFAFLQSKRKTKTVFLNGISIYHIFPNLKLYLREGAYFSSNDEKAILLTEKLAKILALQIGDSALLIVKDLSGKAIQKKYPVKGILHFPAFGDNYSFIFLPLKETQNILQKDAVLNTIRILLKEPQSLQKVFGELQNQFNQQNFSSTTWRESLPDLYQMLLAYRFTGYFTILFLYLTVAFGILSLYVMIVSERRHEFGVLIALGMSRYQLINILGVEFFLLNTLGFLITLAGTVPLIAYLENTPILLSGTIAHSIQDLGFAPLIYFSDEGFIFLQSILILFFISFFAFGFSARMIQKIKVSAAIKQK